MALRRSGFFQQIALRFLCAARNSGQLSVEQHKEPLMGAKTWMLVYCNESVSEALRTNPELDRVATVEFVKKLFPSETLKPLSDVDLSYTCPPDDELIVGCFSGLNIIAAKEFAIDYPSKLSAQFLDPALGNTLYLHAMHSTVDWFAYAIWRDGKLQRSLSLSPDSGVLEDIGTKLTFEEPYWNGQRPAIDPEEDDSAYPFVFHPLELAESALLEFFGYQLEGVIDSSQIEPERIPLMRFKRSRPWWKLW